MAEALSQSQIDELLKRMQSGGVEEEPKEQAPTYKQYDFSSPKKFTKDQIKAMSNLYENFARVVSSYFTGILRNVCEINLAQIEEQRYYEFNNALPDNTLVGIIALQPEGPYDETSLMLELQPGFGFMLIDRLMGGSSEPVTPDRDFTEIEMALLQLIMNNVAKYIKEAWSNFFTLKTKVRSIETNGRLLQAYSPQDVVVIVTLDIGDENTRTAANICMLAENAEQIIDGFSVKYHKPTKSQDPEREQMHKELLLEYLKQSELEVEAVLDVCQMDLSDIALLQPDDVIVLNKPYNADITVNVEHAPWYTARLGEMRSKKALKVTDTIVK